MKNSRKTAVLLATLLSVSLCACGPVEEAADSVSETKDTTTAEAVSDTPDSVEESSQTDDSSQVEIIRDPELVCDLSEIPYTAKCTVEGNFGAEAMLSDYYGINAMINSDEPLLSIPVKYTDADFGGGVIRFEFSDKISDEQKASAVIMQFDEDSTFTKLESFVDENGISANITTGGVYMVIDSYVYDMFNGGSVDTDRYDIENGLTIELSDFSAALELPEIGGFSAAKLEKHEITTDDFDGTRDVKIVYANLIDGKVDEKYDGLNLSLSYYQRLDKTTVDDMLDMYAKSADISSDDNVWLDYRGLDLGNGKRGCVIAALGEDQSVNVQGIYEFSDSEYIQYNVVIPLKYVSMGEDIFDSAMSFRYAE